MIHRINGTNPFMVERIYGSGLGRPLIGVYKGNGVLSSLFDVGKQVFSNILSKIGAPALANHVVATGKTIGQKALDNAIKQAPNALANITGSLAKSAINNMITGNKPRITDSTRRVAKKELDNLLKTTKKATGKDVRKLRRKVKTDSRAMLSNMLASF